MKARDLPRLLRTLWYQSPAQWRGRLRGRSHGQAALRRASGPPPRQVVMETSTPFLAPPAMAVPRGREAVCVHGQDVDGSQFDDPRTARAAWLHRFSWIRHPDLSPEDRAWWLERWLALPTGGVAWRAAETSDRVVAWVKLLATPDALPRNDALRAALLASLVDQVTTLDALGPDAAPDHPEAERALAVAFAAALVDGAGSDGWRSTCRGLPAMLAARVLPDGVQIDRSPSLHLLTLERLLDLLNLGRAADGRLPDRALSAIEETAARMLAALGTFTHPDGEIALFGDSAFGAAPTPSALQGAAEALGLASPQAPEAHLPQGGFARLEAGAHVLLVTAGMPSPLDLPRYAHGDPLSFEWSVAGRRVVVDSGGDPSAALEDDPALRSALAHATAMIEQAEPMEFWGAGRVGGRPDVALPRVQVEEKGGGRIEAVCAGWATPEVLHRRSFELRAEGLEIHDLFDREAREVTFSFPLAPGLEPELAERGATLRQGDQLIEIEASADLQWCCERAPVRAEPGGSVTRAVLRARGEQIGEAHFRFRAGAR